MLFIGGVPSCIKTSALAGWQSVRWRRDRPQSSMHQSNAIHHRTRHRWSKMANRATRHPAGWRRHVRTRPSSRSTWRAGQRRAAIRANTISSRRAGRCDRGRHEDRRPNRPLSIARAIDDVAGAAFDHRGEKNTIDGRSGRVLKFFRKQCRDIRPTMFGQLARHANHGGRLANLEHGIRVEHDPRQRHAGAFSHGRTNRTVGP